MKNFQISNSLSKHANLIRKSIKSPSDFHEFAKTTGISHYKEKNGDWGFMVKSSELKNPVIRDKAFALSEGEISEPFSIDSNDRLGGNPSKIYILMVNDEKIGRLQSINEVRFEIEKILASQIEFEEQSGGSTEENAMHMLKSTYPKISTRVLFPEDYSLIKNVRDCIWL